MPLTAEEAIAEHLFYEAWMLRSMREKLRRRDYNCQNTKIALVESFCIHARNLNEFFLENGQGDTLKASEFTNDEYQPPDNTEGRRLLFQKINKHVSHLTRERTTDPRNLIGVKERERMFALLSADLQNFDRHLRSELLPAWRVKFAKY